MNESILIQYNTLAGEMKLMTIPLGWLAAKPAKLLRRLRRAGVQIAPGCDHYVLEYLRGELAKLSGPLN